MKALKCKKDNIVLLKFSLNYFEKSKNMSNFNKEILYAFYYQLKIAFNKFKFAERKTRHWTTHGPALDAFQTLKAYSALLAWEKALTRTSTAAYSAKSLLSKLRTSDQLFEEILIKKTKADKMLGKAKANVKKLKELVGDYANDTRSLYRRM
jgi:hypothetical protein